MASNSKVFVSPGVYTSEVDLSFVAQSVGVTTLGIVGETLKGPAFEPIFIRNFDEFTGFSVIRAFLDDSSASAFFQLTVFGRGFNNDKGHRKDLWLRLLVSLPNVQQSHEWIDGSNRYLRKEVGRKDDHVNFNRTRNETDFVPFEFNLAKMLQGQRKNYESARVK